MINKNNINQYKDIEGNWTMLNTRAYFDIHSHEFKSMALQEKLNNLGFLISEGMELPDIIMQYCDNHSSHIVDAVKPALLYYIQQMRWSEPCHCTDELFDDMSEVEMSVLVQDEIKARYAFWKVNCSCWDESIMKEMAIRSENDKTKFVEILLNAEFSKEYQNRNRI